MSHNRLSGSLPSSFKSLSLKYLDIQMNAVSGAIPNSLFKSSELMTINSRDNESSKLLVLLCVGIIRRVVFLINCVNQGI